MKHQGKIFEKAIRNSKIPIKTVAELSGYSGRHFYNLFEAENLPNDLFIRVGRIIGYDYSKDIPELTEFLMIREPQEAYNLNLSYQQKYLELLEKYIEISDELNAIKTKTEPIPYKKPPIKKRAK